MCGSSPHAWGTPGRTDCRNWLRRFIPTRVGNTYASQSAPWPCAVHPHTRGEHRTIFALVTEDSGSSPHAWGTHGASVSSTIELRFIPTRVGNTLSYPYASQSGPVHPHTRGEHATFHSPATSATGSSPHAWGTPFRLTHFNRERRFIPTRVGNTPAAYPPRRRTPVHPHTRGEHGVASSICASSFGSSPHAWGTRLKLMGRFNLIRFIPTRVGNTWYYHRTDRRAAVHPHTRGEHHERMPHTT